MTDFTNDQLTKYGGIDFANGASFRLLEDLPLSRFVDALNNQIRVWRKRVQERKELAGANSRDLADIGFSVPHAKFEMNKPFWRR